MSTTATASGSASQPPPLVCFFEHPNGSADFRGRTLSDILDWPDAQLEYSHDYIQFVFPLPEHSPVNPRAPVVDRAAFEAFQNRPELRDRLRQAFERIIRFYGLGLRLDDTASDRPVNSVLSSFSTCKGNGNDITTHASSYSLEPDGENHDHSSNSDNSRKTLEVVPATNFPTASTSWVRSFSHNHLRITRIIRSLRVLGLEPEAQAFYKALKTIYYSDKSKISSKSLTFWSRAAKRPLNVPPDINSEHGWGKRGEAFLREFEERRRQA